MATKKQKEAGAKALKNNSHLQSVFVTEDNKPFVNKNAAINYSVSNKKDPEKVIEYSAPEVESSNDDPSTKDQSTDENTGLTEKQSKHN